MIRKLALGAATAGMTAIVALLFVFAPVTARETAATPALWKIDGPTGDVYLFGSIHILPKGLQWRRPELEAALAQSQRLVFEINMDEASDPLAMVGLLTKIGFLPPDKSLHKMLAPEYRAKLDKVGQSVGVPPAALDRMRPWLAAIMLTSLNLVKQTSKDGKPVDPSAAMTDLAGVDMQLWTWGKSAGKELGALETAEDQIRIFADMPENQQVQFLIATLEEVSAPQATLDALFDAWKKGDVAKLDKTLNGEMDAFPALRKALYEDRHVKWLPQIERMTTDGKTHVVIVGAAHLTGKGSVIEMLRAKGIKVEGP